MSRLEVPLQHRMLKATGDVLLWAELDLLLKDGGGRWRPATFLVDSGTEMTTMPARVAKQLDLPLPLQAIRGAVPRQTGLPIRSGRLRARIVGLDGTEFLVPCFFLGDPHTPPGVIQPATGPRNLLGLTGVVNQIRLLFDGTPTPIALFGNLIVEKR
jgi:hypothetical protein